MIKEWVLPGLLETGAVEERILAVQDGLVNLYVVRGPGGLVCIDAGWRPQAIAHGFRQLGLKIGDVAAVFLTHRHWDHARGADCFANARVYAGGEAAAKGKEAQTNASTPRVWVRDGEVIMAAGLAVRVIGTPGHTPDSVSYVIANRYLFTGDALRLRRGKAVPFPTKFNHDQDAARDALRRLARVEGIEWLLSAHTGATRAVAAAFQDWREEEA